MSWCAGCWAGDDYDLAVQEVADTQALNRRTGKEKTYHLIISFHPEDEGKLTPDVFKQIEERFADALGLSEHQRHCGVHVNTENIHMHVAYNLIHPEKLTRVEPWRDYIKRDKLCRELEKEYGLTFADHYARTGIQYQPFNTVYQLMALKKEHPEQLAAAKTFLMVPDYLNYLLCGVPANEYTNASTTALVGADSRDWDDALIEKLGLPRGIFQPIKTAGTVLGHLTPEIQKAVGFDAEVILPATHDTGSAFLAVPARDEYAAYLSSGTWSLLGVENAAAITGPDSCAANFTNEGGYEYRYRYLKNIMGLWMIQSVRRELGEKTGTRPSFPELIAAAKEAADFPSCVDPDDNRFLAPASMIEEVRAACADTHQPVPAATGEVMQCVYNSLTQDYRRAVETLQTLTGKTYTSLNIVGGGSQDGYLNQQTANATGLTVFAGPTEGTALGNLMVQFIHSGDFADLAEARAAIRRSFAIKEYQPE